jgi:hypothetical protein
MVKIKRAFGDCIIVFVCQCTAYAALFVLFPLARPLFAAAGGRAGNILFVLCALAATVGLYALLVGKYRILLRYLLLGDILLWLMASASGPLSVYDMGLGDSGALLAAKGWIYDAAGRASFSSAQTEALIFTMAVFVLQAITVFAMWVIHIMRKRPPHR